MAKCMIYIGTYAWGKCYGKCLTASPRRPRPLGGSVINGTIQQLLDTPRAEPVTTNLAGDAHTAPHSRATWFHPRGCGKAPTAPAQRHTAARRGFTARHPRGCGKAPTAPTQRHTVAQRGFIREDAARPPQRLVRAGAGHFSPLGNLEKQSKGINP